MHPIFSLMRLSVGLLAAATTRARMQAVLHCRAMPAARLYESPFTDIHAQGPDGVFEAAKVELLFKALEPFDPLQKVA